MARRPSDSAHYCDGSAIASQWSPPRKRFAIRMQSECVHCRRRASTSVPLTCSPRKFNASFPGGLLKRLASDSQKLSVLLVCALCGPIIFEILFFWQFTISSIKIWKSNRRCLSETSEWPHTDQTAGFTGSFSAGKLRSNRRLEWKRHKMFVLEIP